MKRSAEAWVMMTVKVHLRAVLPAIQVVAAPVAETGLRLRAAAAEAVRETAAAAAKVHPAHAAAAKNFF